MKLNKFLIGALALTVASTSCSDSFLDEEQINVQTTDYFNTQEGIDDLITGAYSIFKYEFNYAWAYTTYFMGGDEYNDANNESAPYHGYQLISDNGDLKTLWENMYNRIEAANVAIESILAGNYDPTASTYNTRLGEAYFIRAYAHFALVKQFGAVPLKTKACNGILETHFIRDTEEDCFEQIISDFEEAEKLLPAKGETIGRLTKAAGKHFVAKARLHRVSERYASWNSTYVEEDLRQIIIMAEDVIQSNPLCNDFVELFDYKKANSDNEKVSEIILSAQFSDDQTTWGRFGNQLHLAFPSVYQNMAGTKRDISGDREFCYLRTTDYTLDCFDRINDSRFWKSFITTYGCNSTVDAPKWTQDMANLGLLPAGVNVDESRFVGGDLAIKYIVNDPGDNTYKNAVNADGAALGEAVTIRDGAIINTHTFVRYYEGEAENWYGQHGNYGGYKSKSRFVANSKHRDGYRISIANQFGTRDGIIARTGETVLIAAEAYARQNKYDKAIEKINLLRTRAGYAKNEDRARHVDGGQAYMNNTYCEGKGGGYSADGAIFHPTNTYFESNKMEGQELTATGETKTALLVKDVDDAKAQDQKIFDRLKAIGKDITSDKEIMLYFIMNEYTRELTGESHRWEELARTKQLGPRYNAFNDAKESRSWNDFDADKHIYRPIPQSYLDGITNQGGSSLSDEEKAAQQNPGY